MSMEENIYQHKCCKCDELFFRKGKIHVTCDECLKLYEGYRVEYDEFNQLENGGKDEISYTFYIYKDDDVIDSYSAHTLLEGYEWSSSVIDALITEKE